MNPKHLNGKPSLSEDDILVVSLPTATFSRADYKTDREISFKFEVDSVITLVGATVSNPRVGDSATTITGKANEVFDALLLGTSLTLKLPEISNSGSIGFIDGGTF